MSECRLGEMRRDEVHRLLRAGDLALRTGSLRTRIRCGFPDVADSLHAIYAEHPVSVRPDFSDFHVEVRSPLNLRRWMRRQAEFLFEGHTLFEPLPRDQAPALIEWGLNWSISAYCHQWFTIHAASLERGGRALILPAPPGSGKSTLCAALAFSGWRLLSDELTMLDPETLQASALARPINLKNASIDVLRAFAPQAVWAPETYDTKKGRVTHLRPPADSVSRMLETARPRWVVFPKYVSGADPMLRPRTKTATFIEVAQNAFNYSTLGELGFDVVARLMDSCDCYDFEYSRLEDALEVFDWLATADDAPGPVQAHTAGR